MVFRSAAAAARAAPYGTCIQGVADIWTPLHVLFAGQQEGARHRSFAHVDSNTETSEKRRHLRRTSGHVFGSELPHAPRG